MDMQKTILLTSIFCLVGSLGMHAQMASIKDMEISTQDQLDQMLVKHSDVVVGFYQTSDDTRVFFENFISQKQKNDNKVHFALINKAVFPQAFDTYGVTKTPVMMLFHNETVVRELKDFDELHSCTKSFDDLAIGDAELLTYTVGKYFVGSVVLGATTLAALFFKSHKSNEVLALVDNPTPVVMNVQQDTDVEKPAVLAKADDLENNVSQAVTVDKVHLQTSDIDPKKPSDGDQNSQVVTSVDNNSLTGLNSVGAESVFLQQPKPEQEQNATFVPEPLRPSESEQDEQNDSTQHFGPFGPDLM